MRNLLKGSLLLLFLSNIGFTQPLDPKQVNQFIDEMVNKHGFDTNELRILFGGTKYSDKVLQAMAKPAEDLAWYKYRKIFLNDSRIKKGVTFWKKYKDSLNRAEEIYGNPPQIIIAIVGVETQYGKYKGKTLGLTLSTEPMIQWYRTDIYDKLGLKPATTWEEYKANAIAVQESGLGDGVLLGWGPRVTWWWMTLVWSFGGHLYDDHLVPTLDTPEGVEATTYLKELTAYGPEGGLSTDGDGVTNKFLSQDIGSILQYSGYYAMTLDASNNRYAGLIGTAPMPMGSVDVTHLAGWNIGIPSDSKQKDLAWQFLE